MVGLSVGPSTIAVMSLGLFIGPLERDFGWPRQDVAFATVIVSWAIVAVSPLQGMLVDRFGARRVILVSIPAFALGIAALAALPANRIVYYGLWALIPFLGAGLFPLAYLKIVSTWFERRLGLAIGVANAGIGVGSALIPLCIAPVIAAAGWRSGYMCLAVLALCMAFPAAFFFLRERTDAMVPPGMRASAVNVPFASAWRTPHFARLGVTFALLGIVNTALIVHQIPLLLDSGVTPARAALVQSIFGLSMILGRVGSGWLLDLVDPPFVLAGLAAGAAAACLTYAAGLHGAADYLSASLIAFLIGAEFDVLAYLIKAWFGPVAFGRLYGVIFALFQIAAGTGAALLPLMRSHYGSYREGLWLFAVILAAVTTMALTLRKAAVPARGLDPSAPGTKADAISAYSPGRRAE